MITSFDDDLNFIEKQIMF